MNTASYQARYRSGQRQSHLPLPISENWAHNRAETEITTLPAASFTGMSHLHTYWLVINDLAIGTAIKNSTEVQCRCVSSPMIQCLSDSVTRKCHAFRYHVNTDKVTCAEMNRGRELDELLTACGEKNPNFAARVIFVYGGENELLDTTDELDWW